MMRSRIAYVDNVYHINHADICGTLDALSCFIVTSGIVCSFGDASLVDCLDFNADFLILPVPGTLVMREALALLDT